MHFKQHPIFDESNALDWLELDDVGKDFGKEAGPFAYLIQLYQDHQQYIETRAIVRIRCHWDSVNLASKTYVEQYANFLRHWQIMDFRSTTGSTYSNMQTMHLRKMTIAGQSDTVQTSLMNGSVPTVTNI